MSDDGLDLDLYLALQALERAGFPIEEVQVYCTGQSWRRILRLLEAEERLAGREPRRNGQSGS
jgi:hypothetical protein